MNCAGPGWPNSAWGFRRPTMRRIASFPACRSLTTRDSPWLYNGTLALHLTDRLVAYAGYTSGLEESGTAPANAVNRNSAPPALRTSQRDAGMRYAISPRLSFVAGVFDVRKPYFNLDPGRVYRELGTVRHRGIELSLAGQPIEGLSIVAGAVLLDARRLRGGGGSRDHRPKAGRHHREDHPRQFRLSPALLRAAFGGSRHQPPGGKGRQRAANMRSSAASS